MVDRFLDSYPTAVQELKIMENKDQQSGRRETSILIAAKMGVAEMVHKILDTFPVAMQDVDSEKKKIFVLLAIENHKPVSTSSRWIEKYCKKAFFDMLTLKETMHCILQLNLKSMDLGVFQELYCKCNRKSSGLRYICVGKLISKADTQLK